MNCASTLLLRFWDVEKRSAMNNADYIVTRL